MKSLQEYINESILDSSYLDDEMNEISVFEWFNNCIKEYGFAKDRINALVGTELTDQAHGQLIDYIFELAKSFSKLRLKYITDMWSTNQPFAYLGVSKRHITLGILHGCSHIKLKVYILKGGLGGGLPNKNSWYAHEVLFKNDKLRNKSQIHYDIWDNFRGKDLFGDKSTIVQLDYGLVKQFLDNLK